MMSIVNPLAISVETIWTDSRCFLEKEFIELIRTNPGMVIILTIYQVDSCHGCVCDPLT